VRHRRGDGSDEPEHVPHVGKANAALRASRGHEPRRAQRARREVLPRCRPVRKLDQLAGTRENHRVLADDIASARAAKPIAPAFAVTFAREDRAVGQDAPEPRRGFVSSAVPEGASPLPVMHLENLDIDRRPAAAPRSRRA
jgi:hypothetical protein